MRRMRTGRSGWGIGWALAAACGAAQGIVPCRIEVVESGSGWPVPLVELRTTHEERFVSDNAGVIAFDLPELMGRDVWFDVVGHGYERKRDGFGSRGVRLRPVPGGDLRVEVDRVVVARRLGRITGAGIFAESQKLGAEEGWAESGVTGCDSVQCALYRGRLHWFWGDTNLARYRLGIFHATGGVSDPGARLDPRPPVRLGIDLFRDRDGAPRAVARMAGEGPTWLTGVVTLPDREGRERLVSAYLKVKPPLEAVQWGLCEWDDAIDEFRPLRVIWTKSEQAPQPPPIPEGQAVPWRDAGGREWVLFGNPLPRLRCPARFEAWSDPSTWERLEPPAELASASGDGAVKPHSGSIAWSAWRGRWVTVFLQAFGRPSVFGELWYAEAREPTGPWGPAVKVLSHENYTFYNPRLHPELGRGGSSALLFEGTYTRQFADHAAATPRHDYNQILYLLDLDDPALGPARVE